VKEQTVIDFATSLFFEQALVKAGGEFVGAQAAIPKPSKTDQSLDNKPDLNYGEVFIRDNVPVMIYLLLVGKNEIVRHFLNTCLQLQGHQFQTRGIFPTSFIEANQTLVADYGQRAIGRVCSVDASLWWMILAYIYTQRTGDREWASSAPVQLGIQRFLGLILHPRFSEAPTLFVPDGAFMIDRPLDVWGNPLEIQVLLYGALLSAVGLLQISQVPPARGFLGSSLFRPKAAFGFSDQPDPDQQIQALAWIVRLRRYLLKNYWVTSKAVQTLRRRPTEQYGDDVMNEYNIQTETIPHWLQDWLGEQGGYLIGNIRTGRPDFRFFTLGNCLGCLFDVISPQQQRSLFSLIRHNRTDLLAQMPLRICHPPLDDGDWRKKTGYDRKNLPWCYHNAGHWPCLHWFLVAAILRHQQCYAQSEAETAANNSMLEDSYQLLLRRLPQQNWSEYFDGPTGVWVGQQARFYQTWTIVGMLLVHHLLKVNPNDAQIMSLPSLRSLMLRANAPIS
jgi:hypothetical protein